MNKWHIGLSILGAIGALCLLYGFFIEPKCIHQRLVTVTIPVSHVTHLSKPLVSSSQIFIGSRTLKRFGASDASDYANEPDATF